MSVVRPHPAVVMVVADVLDDAIRTMPMDTAINSDARSLAEALLVDERFRDILAFGVAEYVRCPRTFASYVDLVDAMIGTRGRGGPTK